jgi:hypothetical protein
VDEKGGNTKRGDRERWFKKQINRVKCIKKEKNSQNIC